MYQASVNNGNNYHINYAEKEIKVDEALFEWDIRHIGDNQYHLIQKGISYRLEVVEALPAEKKYILKINGQKVEVRLKDRYDLLLEKLGMSTLSTRRISQIKAPMPGLIFEIKVKEGMEVKKGDPIMVLEAMKMENILKSPGDGLITAIKVKQGQSVEKNQVLIEF